MPRYWILCMSEDNYLIAKKHGLIGISERAKAVARQIGIGDMIAFYISKKTVDARPNDRSQRVQQFRGIARVTGEASVSDDPVWHVRGSEVFPHRMPVEFFSDTAVGAIPLGKQLSYVRNISLWGKGRDGAMRCNKDCNFLKTLVFESAHPTVDSLRCRTRVRDSVRCK